MWHNRPGPHFFCMKHDIVHLFYFLTVQEWLQSCKLWWSNVLKYQTYTTPLSVFFSHFHNYVLFTFEFLLTLPIKMFSFIILFQFLLKHIFLDVMKQLLIPRMEILHFLII